MVLFGPAGNSDLFYKNGNKHTYQAPKWIHDMGLTAFEYSFGHGVRMKEETAAKIRDEAQKYNIALSVHAPYYINLAAVHSFEKNLSYIEQSVVAAEMLGADRVVIHPGSLSQLVREKAFENVFESFSKIIKILSEKGHNQILYCPETMGKINQIGDLAEIAQLCSIDERVYPTIDFAHLHARTQGGISGKDDFDSVISFLENRIGKEKVQYFHAHFSKIEYTHAGEKMHRTFAEKEYGPDFAPLAELLVEKAMSPRIICESRGTQDIDAKKMMEIYNEERKRFTGR
jgi:deoxyribonuclease-4